MHADINPQTVTIAPRGDARFPRRWLVMWLAAVLFCLVAALHFGSLPPDAASEPASSAQAPHASAGQRP